MKAVIVDDEKHVRETTGTLLSIYCPDITICGQAQNVSGGVELIRKEQPELVFLDVEMEDGTGFDLLSRFPERNFQVIFITGHNDYAIRAFKFSALDYILKPVDPEDLERAVKKAQKELASGESRLQLKALENNFSDRKPSKIILKDSDNVYLISISEIIRCEADGNYTHFFLEDKRKLTISTTLKEYDQLLSDQGFFRSHQSHLINLNFFNRLEKKDGGIIYMKDGSAVPISTRKRDHLMKALNDLM